MNPKPLWAVAAIIVAIGFASNVLFVNSSFAESEARKAMKDMVKKQDEAKKAKIAAKKADIKAAKLKALQAKLAKYLVKLANDPNNQTLQQKIAKLNAQIQAVQASGL